MCEQCTTQSISHGEVIPGIFLIEATKDGEIMEAGDWGLVIINDPFMVWGKKPVVENDDAGTRKCLDYRSYLSEFCDKCYMSPEDGHFLIESAMKQGFKPKTYLAKWLANKVAEHLSKNKVAHK